MVVSKLLGDPGGRIAPLLPNRRPLFGSVLFTASLHDSAATRPARSASLPTGDRIALWISGCTFIRLISRVHGRAWTLAGYRAGYFAPKARQRKMHD
jgi:hypothetical protein